MIADRFWELLSKQVFAEANEAELKELRQWLIDHPRLSNVSESLNILSHQSLPVEKNSLIEKTFENHVKRIKDLGIEFNKTHLPDETETVTKGKTRRQITKWGLLLGALSIVAIFFLVLKNNIVSSKSLPKASSQLKVFTKPASKTQLLLPDGSSVWLNASSNLTYDKDFGKDFREVNLTGEAFFDVVKDPSRPFIIHTKVIDIKVLGTEFNVSAYPNDEYTETSLIRGSVEVTVKNRPDEKHYLKPNEKMRISNNILYETTPKTAKSEPFIRTQPLTYYHTDSTIIETSWVENKLIFQENETFKEVASRMERWYGVQISFADDEVAQIRPFGSFTTETITQALDALRESFKFNYKTTGNTIIITK